MGVLGVSERGVCARVSVCVWSHFVFFLVETVGRHHGSSLPSCLHKGLGLP